MPDKSLVRSTTSIVDGRERGAAANLAVWTPSTMRDHGLMCFPTLNIAATKVGQVSRRVSAQDPRVSTTSYAFPCATLEALTRSATNSSTAFASRKNTGLMRITIAFPLRTITPARVVAV